MESGRREFIEVLVFMGAATVLGACGGDTSDPGGSPGGGGGTPNCTANGGKAQTITANHGHRLFIPAADFSAGVPQTYNIQGTSTHSHTIDLSPAQLATIAAGGAVTVKSTPTDHDHDVTCVCA